MQKSETVYFRTEKDREGYIEFIGICPKVHITKMPPDVIDSEEDDIKIMVFPLIITRWE